MPDPATLSVVAAVVERAGRFLVTRRLQGTHLEGVWEFPGGKCEPGETHAACLAREIREELDAEVEIGDALLSTQHAYPDRRVDLHFYRCRLRGTPRPRLGQQLQWVPRGELARLDLPPADAELIRLLVDG